MSEYIELDLSIGNRIFKAFESFQPKEGRKTIYLPNKALKTAYLVGEEESTPEDSITLYQALNDVYGMLTTGEKLDEEATTVAIGFRLMDGERLVPNRTYAPSIYRGEDGLLLRWGNTYLPVEYDAKAKEFSCNGVSLELQQTKVGFFDELVLTGYFEVIEDLTYIVHFPLRPKNFKEKLVLSEIKGYLKKDYNKFLDLINERPNPADGGAKKAGLGRAMTDVRKLAPDHTYNVLKAEARTTRYGPTYVLLIEANPEAGLEEDTTAWSYSSINGLLEAGLELPSKLTYTRTEEVEGKPRHKFVFDSPVYKGNNGGLDLTWLQ